jgi:ERCC4-type nuclease
MYILKIDVREKDLLKLIPALIKDNGLEEKVTVSFCSLDIGDFIIERNVENKENEEVIIFERKSIKDLAASIQDGRYNEQSLRLDSIPLHNHNIYYIIEGSIDKYYNKYCRVTKEAIYSSIFSLNYYKGFSVLRTDNVLETGTFIVKILKKLLRDVTKEPYFKNTISSTELNNNQNGGSEGKQNTSQPEYTSVVKRVKKDNITPENIGSVILSQIPGISGTISKVIMDKYGSLYELMLKLHDDPNLLNNETYVTSKGQTRRISHKCIQSIKDFILYKREHVININTLE